MPTIKVILTGATGMVGEGVLLECLQNEKVSEVLSVTRRHFELTHPKLTELIVPDFMKLEEHAGKLQGFDACFFCAGVSSIGMNEENYTKITYDTTMHFAKTVLHLNPGMVFTYVTGAQTDSSEKGRLMWARVKGKTENDLMKLGFKGEYNFRPGVMQPFKEQKNVKALFKPFLAIFSIFAPNILTLQEVGRAMIRTATEGYSKHVLEVSDIKALGRQ